ncbi:mitochondrial import receptor subunit TOM7 homolog isoform X2 [Bubalus kerabau]|uniref:mitochondrial import receptor subunit TOM7 homolog isoform X2 n=1 Tax=Bubalus carabanensis TaxID=3119969 RepID=UPI00244E685C|nr:mitochondrial import receptor subunit TOM7 homolog isoform X2 [Bubalus carabanensis]
MNCDLRLATLTTPAVKAGVARARLLSCRFQTRLLFSHGCRQRCRNGEAEQRGQAEAAAAFQGRTICHPLGFYSSRDLPGSVGEEPGFKRGADPGMPEPTVLRDLHCMLSYISHV